MISGAIESLTAKFDLDPGMKGWASGCVLIGCAAGVLLVGPISDRFGPQEGDVPGRCHVPGFRHRHGAAQRYSRSSSLFRFLGGLGIGIASMSTPMYIAEITPAHLRGRMVAVNQIAIVGGIAASGIHELLHCPAYGDRAGTVLVQGLAVDVCRGDVPSSPSCSPVASPFRKVPAGWPRWAARTRPLRSSTRVGGDEFARTEMHGIRQSLASDKGTWRDLFSRKLMVPLLLGIALAVASAGHGHQRVPVFRRHDLQER